VEKNSGFDQSRTWRFGEKVGGFEVGLGENQQFEEVLNHAEKWGREEEKTRAEEISSVKE
jgi:hypothetical protein